MSELFDEPNGSLDDHDEDGQAEMDTLTTHTNSHDDRENGEMDEEDTTEPILSTEELQAGYKILSGLMAWSLKHVNWPFMESIEKTDPELFESYKLRIKKPMWLKRMKQKFIQQEYTTITEFVADFRLMLENCYHFNGPDHFVSKRAVKLETMLEQKLALLSRDIREKTTLAATSGQKDDQDSTGLGLRRRTKTLVPHNSTSLMNQLREEQIQKKKERRRKMIMDRRAEREALAQEICTWEEEVLFAGKKDEMKAMWEIPQIGLFLFLLQDPLNVGEVMHFELERCFMMCRESTTMHRIMTSLLSSPFQRLKIDKKTVMPYRVWDSKLQYKLQVWYKIFHDSGENVTKTCNKLGLEEKFFEVVGHKNPMEKKKYHELSFYKKVWIMKALCDHCLHMQETLRDMIELQPFEDQRELILGTDGQGQRYIHFPQFCGADVRVYRQAPFKYPKIKIETDTFDSKRKFPFVYKPPPRKKVKMKKTAARRSPVAPRSPAKQRTPSPSPSPRNRPSRLRQAPKSVVPLQLADEASVTETNSSDSDDYDDNNSRQAAAVSDLSDKEMNDDKLDDKMSSASDATIPYCDDSDTNSNVSSRDMSRDSSPYSSCPDLRGRPDPLLNRSSDVSRGSSPCISSADFLPRRSARLDKTTPGDSSPLIFDVDFGLRRGRRRGTVLKNLAQYNSARDTPPLYDDNSCSNSSVGGEAGFSGGGASHWEKRSGTSRRSSYDTSDESNLCDISKLFSNSKSVDINIGDSDEKKSVDSGSEWIEELTDRNNTERTTKITDLGSERVDQLNDSKDKDNETNTTPNHSDSIASEVLDETSEIDTNMEVDNGDDATQEKTITNNNNFAKPISEQAKHAVSENSLSEESKDAIGDTESGSRESDNVIDNIEREKDAVESTAAETDGKTNVETERDKSKSEDKKESEFAKLDHVSNVKGDDSDDIHQTKVLAVTKVNEGENEKEKIDRNSEVEKIGESDDIEMNDGNKYDISDVGDSQDLKIEIKGEMQTPTKGGEIKPSKSEQQTNELETKVKTELVDSDENNDKDRKIKKEDPDKAKIKAEDMAEDPIEDDRAIAKVKTEGKNEDQGSDVKVKKEIKDEKEEEMSDEEEEILPDPKQFLLVADSVAELRALAEKFAEPEPIILRRGKKEIVQKMPPRKKSEVTLHERLLCLLKELEPWEHRLQQATRNARIRLRREVEEFEEEEEEEDGWNTTDEETESGESDTEKPSAADPVKPKPAKPSTSATNSPASTPVKQLEEMDTIDVSQRGRLRKRRIIPNNVEDQFGSKKPRQVTKAEDTQTTTEPVIVQQSKTELVDYVDIIRHLQNRQGGKPLLIKSSRGGRTVLTSVMPIGHGGSSGEGVVKVQTGSHTITAPTALPGTVITSPHDNTTTTSVRVSQHPTIRTLLSASLATSSKSVVHLNPNLLTNVPSIAGSHTGGVAIAPKPVHMVDGDGSLHISQTDGKPHQAPTAPLIQVCHSNTASHPTIHATNQQSPSPTLLNVAVSSDNLTKYHVANSNSGLPPEVVSQLMSKQCATVATGKKSIFLIPVEKEGGASGLSMSISPGSKLTSGANLTSSMSPMTPARSASIVTSSSPVMSLSSPGKDVTITSTSPGHKTPNKPILPKPSLTPSVQRIPLQQGILGLQGAIVTQGVLQQRVMGGLNGSLNKLAHTSSSTSPRYPSNETVRTLLDKRKSTEDKPEKMKQDEMGSPYKVMKLFLNTSSGPVTGSNVPSQALNSSASSTVKLGSDTILSPSTKSMVSPQKMVQVVMSVNSAMASPVKSENVASIPKQQCVITSISPANLNTLLLQTNAAGAKSIPSLIKLPSKAALDSAVKAVVTSVNTTLPTVNIKVPSPTSLPNIGPRRNVTKTIQTMKSPIPVAPKVVTQHSGGRATLSMSNSSTLSNAQYLAVPSLHSQNMPASQLLQSQVSMARLGQKEVTSSLAGFPDHVTLAPKGDLKIANSTHSTNPASHPTHMDQSQSHKPVLTSPGLDNKQMVKLVSPSAGSQQTGATGQPTILTKMIPKMSSPLFINSKGYVQLAMGMNVLQGKEQESPGCTMTQSTPQSTPVPSSHRSASPAQAADKSTPVIALNASGIPIGAIRRSSVGHVSASTETPKPQLVQSYIMAQSSSQPTTPAPVIGQGNLMSNLIGVNLPAGMALAGGVQLASPLGLQLLQSPLAGMSPNLEQLQSGNSQLVSPLSVQANMAGLRLVQKAPTTQNPQAAATLLTVANTADSQPTQVLASSVLGSQLTENQHGMQQNVQQFSAGQQLAAVTSQFLQSKLHVQQRAQATQPSSMDTKPSNTACPITTAAQKPFSVHTVQINTSQPSTAAATQQKLLLFSIGGQLVTGQGVPVTLANGVLKVLPQAKVKINNQTLTPEQVKQTLAKINEAATHAATTQASSAPSIANQGAVGVRTVQRQVVAGNSGLHVLNGKGAASNVPQMKMEIPHAGSSVKVEPQNVAHTVKLEHANNTKPHNIGVDSLMSKIVVTSPLQRQSDLQQMKAANSNVVRTLQFNPNNVSLKAVSNVHKSLAGSANLGNLGAGTSNQNTTQNIINQQRVKPSVITMMTAKLMKPEQSQKQPPQPQASSHDPAEKNYLIKFPKSYATVGNGQLDGKGVEGKGAGEKGADGGPEEDEDKLVVDEEACTEKEAALNLLTLAHQNLQ